MPTLIGRKQEQKTLEQIWRSKEAELCAIYGRRRVGKTFLVRSYFQDKGLYLEFTGIKNGSLATIKSIRRSIIQSII